VRGLIEEKSPERGGEHYYVKRGEKGEQTLRGLKTLRRGRKGQLAVEPVLT